MNYLGWNYNGLVFGNGTNLAVVDTDGFDDLPPVRAQDMEKAAAHGAYAGVDLLGERSMVIKFALLGQDRPSYDSLVQQMATAFAVQPAELPLYCGDNGTRMVNCRPRKMAMPRSKDFHGIYNTSAQVELVATDPRIYATTLTSASTRLAATSGGVTFPATFPLSFGSASSGGLISLTNAGTFATDSTMTITGPVVNPIVDNVTQGLSLLLGITLSATDTLVLDTFARTVVLNPNAAGVGASRSSTLLYGSTWWSLPAGQTQLRYRNNGSYTTSQLTVSFRSAWLALASGGA